MHHQFKHPIYIWQQPEWPQFRWDSERLLEPVSRVSSLHGQLKGQMAMAGFAEQEHAQLEALTSELVASSQIEGITLNPVSVRSSIARRLGLDYDGLLSEDHYVEGLTQVMADAVTNSRHPLTADRIFDWHHALFPSGRSGMYRIAVGEWRTGQEPMQVVSGPLGRQRVHYEAPPSEAVPGMMQALIDWCNTAELSPFIMAGVVHLWFVTVHPLDDGNGRLSRTLADMMLARLDDNARYYSMSAEINRNKSGYYDILERTQHGTLDITSWLLWFMEHLESALRRALDTVQQTMAKAVYWQQMAGVVINERQRKVINRLWDGFDGKLTTSKWGKICHCSQDTALRDINDLIAKGMLVVAPGGGRSTNYTLPGVNVSFGNEAQS